MNEKTLKILRWVFGAAGMILVGLSQQDFAQSASEYLAYIGGMLIWFSGVAERQRNPLSFLPQKKEKK